MPLTRCSRASWSTLGLAVLPDRRSAGHGRLLASGVCLAGAVCAVTLGGGALGVSLSLGAGLGRAALASVGLGRVGLASVGLGRVGLASVRLAGVGLAGVSLGSARL